MSGHDHLLVDPQKGSGVGIFVLQVQYVESWHIGMEYAGLNDITHAPTSYAAINGAGSDLRNTEAGLDRGDERPTRHRDKICRATTLSLKGCVDGRELLRLRCRIRGKVVPDANVTRRGPGSESLVEDDRCAGAVFKLDSLGLRLNWPTR
jgi:hypothetical protein